MNGALTNGAPGTVSVSGSGDSQAHAGNTVPNGSNTVTTAHGALNMNADGSFVYNRPQATAAPTASGTRSRTTPLRD